ncbi:hypothetical protein SAMN06295981_0072 [Corynebacterium pollutisoli]|uniref:Uncharacterized protein n=1 Tax=Corynebacterium pollutisoli TaxID=1610489 RepID=A0A1X7HVG2_9CORY|nr:hypothetical protein [Corynebacterium pollutisoli]SMG05833.1 hypothetical protein SAMN06295981_0072 [Corynebacterium pollutisoli]
MSESNRRWAPWLAALGALAVVSGLAAVAWPDLTLAQRIGGGLLTLLGAVGVVWAASRSSGWRPLLVAALPALLLTGVLVATMAQNPQGGPSVVAHRSGTLPAAPVDTLDELHAQALDVADQLADGGSTRLIRMNLYTDLSAGTLIDVADNAGGKFRARLETHPRREWQWERESLEHDLDTFDGRRVTFAYDRAVEELTAAARSIGTTPDFETVWIYPGHSALQPLEVANPEALPVAQFNSRARGRDLRLQVLADGTLPDTYFDVTDIDAAREQISNALLLDDRRPAAAELQTLSARSATQLLDGPAIDDRPLVGGVEFRGTVDGDYLQVAVHIGQFPTIEPRTPDDQLGFHPLADIPVGENPVPDTDHLVAWQIRAEDPGIILRTKDGPDAPEQRREL